MLRELIAFAERGGQTANLLGRNRLDSWSGSPIKRMHGISLYDCLMATFSIFFVSGKLIEKHLRSSGFLFLNVWVQKDFQWSCCEPGTPIHMLPPLNTLKNGTDWPKFFQLCHPSDTSIVFWVLACSWIGWSLDELVWADNQ